MPEKIILPDLPEQDLGPPEPPPHGPVVWARNNLFSSPSSTVLTLAGGFVAIFFVRGLIDFLFDAERQWEAVTTNLRLLMVQAYPADEMWRIWTAVGIVIVLTAMSLAIWRAGGNISVRKLTQGSIGVGAFLLFVTLVAGVLFNVITYVLGLIGAIFGGDAPDFDLIEPLSGTQFFWWTLIGVVLTGGSALVRRALGERAKVESIPTMLVAGVMLGLVVASLWVIRVPVPDPEAGVRVSKLEPIADTTSGPWTILFVLAVVTYLLGRALRDRVHERAAKTTLVILWVLSFPFIVLHLGRGVEFQEVSQYLLYGVIFIIGGGAILWYLASETGEVGRGLAALILVAAVASWLVSMPIVLRLLLLMLAGFALAAPTFGGGRGAATYRYLGAWVGIVIVLVYVMLLAIGASTVDTPGETPYGGFMLTWILAIAGLALAFPLGILLALGRTSTMPIFRLISTFYIEVVRGVPLITWLLVSIVVFPIFFPLDVNFVNVAKVTVFIAFFSAAYLAENVRGGLQSIPKGQAEAANALGMTTLQRTVFITLPQALRAVIPALVGQVIAVFKDTSLVAIVGLFDLLKIAKDVIPTQTQPFNFLGSIREALVAAAIIYWIFTFIFSRVSLRLEQKLGVGER